MQLKHNFPAPDPLSDLKARLAAGLERYNGGGTRNRRRGAIWQMMAIIDYLRFQGFASVGHLRPAYEMVSSLGDLEDGKQASWLRPDRTKKGGSPPSSTSREMLREDVAVSVSILMDGGMSEPLANQHVARKLGNLGLKKSAHTAGNWRSEVMAYLPAGGRGPRQARQADPRWPSQSSGLAISALVAEVAGVRKPRRHGFCRS